MKSREYQKEAVKQIFESMKHSWKLRVEISKGLGRSVIIVGILQEACISQTLKVMVLSPNRSTCFQLLNSFMENDNEKIASVVLNSREYSDQNVLITTFADVNNNKAISLGNFDIVIFDGIHYMKSEVIESKITDDKKTCFVGFTSQTDGEISGWFLDAECAFKYTLEDAIKNGYYVKGYEFESIVYKIFESQGFTMKIPSQHKDNGYDLEADKGNEHYVIEIKLWDTMSVSNRVLVNTTEQLMNVANKEKKVPILIIANPISERVRKYLAEFKEIIVMDIANLLFMAKGDTELENLLIANLEYSIGNLKPSCPPSAISMCDLNTNIDSKEINQLMKRIEEWDTQKEDSIDYEKLCFEALKMLFSDDLALWNEQKYSNDGLFRFDLICKIKNGNEKEFWKMAEEYFKSKYIVFEFKNYNGQITQKEIFTTEKYLYAKALRGVAIIISSNGADKHAEKVIRSVLREEGKLIISLSNLDVLEMLKKKVDNEEPSDYLSKKLDELLIELEK